MWGLSLSYYCLPLGSFNYSLTKDGSIEVFLVIFQYDIDVEIIVVCCSTYTSSIVWVDHKGYHKLTIFWVAHCDDPLLLRSEAATFGCCQRQQHLWSHRNPYSRPEAAIFSCGRRPQDFLGHMSRQKSGRMVSLVNESMCVSYLGVKDKLV